MTSVPDYVSDATIAFLGPALVLYVLYWVIRLGVRHGVHDATKDRSDH